MERIQIARCKWRVRANCPPPLLDPNLDPLLCGLVLSRSHTETGRAFGLAFRGPGSRATGRRTLGPAHRASRGVLVHTRSTRLCGHPPGRAGRGYGTSGAGRAYAYAHARSAPTPGGVPGTPTPTGIASGVAVAEGHAGSATGAARVSGRIAVALIAGIGAVPGCIAVAGRAPPVEAGVGKAGIDADADRAGRVPAVPEASFPQPDACPVSQVFPGTDVGSAGANTGPAGEHLAGLRAFHLAGFHALARGRVPRHLA